MFFDYFSLAFRNIKHRGLRSWLTILGVFIGIAAVVALISLGASLTEAITGQFASLDVDKLIIQNAGTGFGPPGSTAIQKLTKHDLDLISSIPGIKEVVPRLIRIVKIEENKETKFFYIGSMPEDKTSLQIIYDSLNLETEKGKKLLETDKGKILLGNYFIKEFGGKLEPDKSLNVQGKDFEIIGIMKKSSSFMLNSVILMLEKDMKDLLQIGDEIDLIVIQVEDKNKIEEIADNIKKKLRKDRDERKSEEDFSVQTPSNVLETANLILNIINLIVIGIAAISLLVGGVGIANTMYTSILERTKEIGVMKAIGAKNSDILWIFLIESGLIGLVGGITGAIFGLGLAFLVAFIAQTLLPGLDFSVKISWTLLLFAVSFSFVSGMIAGVLPALQASKLNPVEALRR